MNQCFREAFGIGTKNVDFRWFWKKVIITFTFYDFYG